MCAVGGRAKGGVGLGFAAGLERGGSRRGLARERAGTCLPACLLPAVLGTDRSSKKPAQLESLGRALRGRLRAGGTLNGSGLGASFRRNMSRNTGRHVPSSESSRKPWLTVPAPTPDTRSPALADGWEEEGPPPRDRCGWIRQPAATQPRPTYPYHDHAHLHPHLDTVTHVTDTGPTRSTGQPEFF